MVIQTPVKPCIDPAGHFVPWDWCQDVVSFDERAPWRGYIPAFDPRGYTHDPVWSWVFPNHAYSPSNLRSSGNSYYVHPHIVTQLKSPIIPWLFQFAQALGAKCGWEGPSPPKMPDIHDIDHEWGSSHEAFACLWAKRRSILDVLGFIANLFIHVYIANLREWSSSSLFAQFDPLIKEFVGNHIFGPRFRGTLIQMGSFHSVYSEASPQCWKWLLSLLHPSPKMPLPLAILRDYFGDDSKYRKLFDFSGIHPKPGTIGPMYNFVLRSIGDSKGHRTLNSNSVRRVHTRLKHVVYSSEVDEFNVRLFFLDKPWVEPRVSSGPKIPCEPSSSDDDDDDPDYADFDNLPTFCNTEQNVRLDYYLSFDNGQKANIDVPITKKQRPQIPLYNQRTQTLHQPLHELPTPIERRSTLSAPILHPNQSTTEGSASERPLIASQQSIPSAQHTSPGHVSSHAPVASLKRKLELVSASEHEAGGLKKPGPFGPNKEGHETISHPAADVTTLESRLSKKDVPVKHAAREYSPSFTWLRRDVSVLGQLGVPVDVSAESPQRIGMNKQGLQTLLDTKSVSYLRGTCSSWVVETSIIVPELGSPVALAQIPPQSVDQGFMRKIRIRTHWKTEMFLISYLEQFPNGSGVELALFALVHGLPIFISWSREDGRGWAEEYAARNATCASSHEQLNHRPIPENISTTVMCQDWLARVKYLCNRPDARRFLFYGGYISRLVVEFAGPDVLQSATQGPSHQFLAHGDRIMFRHGREWDYRESEMADSFDQDPLLKDLYGVTTNPSRSLWPSMEQFAESDRWTGIWSTHNESWFKSMMELIIGGRLPAQEWNHKRVGTNLDICIQGQGNPERKISTLRKMGASLLRKWRGVGIPELAQTPLERHEVLDTSMSHYTSSLIEVLISFTSEVVFVSHIIGKP